MAQKVEDDVREWMQTALKVGVPSALLMFLIFWLTGDFNVRLKAIESQHVQAATLNESSKDLAGRALMTNEKVLWVLEVMCANDAKSAEARERCLRGR